MTAQAVPTTTSATLQSTADDHAGGDPVAAAAAHVAAHALTHGTQRRVGLELEFHLVELARPDVRPAWRDVLAVVDGLPPMPSGSTVTVEPGGQLELSTPPRDDLVTAVTALHADRDCLRTALAFQGYGAAPLGSDPVREPVRTNPHPRYAAMEAHFDSRSCVGPARSMMTATAALQVNLDAGPREQWTARADLLRSMVPLLVAVSATSPVLGGRASGWHSMRQETWHGIDHDRSDPVTVGEPGVAWALYALDAPVMLLHDCPADGGAPTMLPVTTRVRFGEWLRHPALLGRPATLEDLDYHLTTLFPPIRPRGYLEIRCVDAAPDRWWPALAAFVVTLADDPVAADVAADLCAPTGHLWETAARTGLRDPSLRAAAKGCAEIVASRCPSGLESEVADLAELLTAGRTPGDELREVARTRGPLALLEEEARA